MYRLDGSLPPEQPSSLLPRPAQVSRPAGASGALRVVGDSSIPLGSEQPCPRCQAMLIRQATPPNAQGVMLHYWSACACVEAGRAAQNEAVRQARERLIASDTALLGDPGARRIQGKTLATFDPTCLAGDGPNHPYQAATSWLAQALDADISDERVGPPPLLWFYSPTKGCGKTHLAAGLYWEAQAAHKRVACIEEVSYLSLAWNTDFGPAREQLVALPAEQAWLTVIDDLGRRSPGKGATGTQNAWSDIISRRYLARRWTIITSNYLPHELAARGTLDEASISRLAGLMRGEILYFDGVDQRMQRCGEEEP